jgi:bla regulator protein BlaR1
MILKYLSAMWTAIAPVLGNQLWQSTLFVIAVGLLTLFLRKNQARVRYGLWLAASLKFLIPFSLLAGIGSHLAWSHSVAGTNAGLYLAMEQVSQPFTQPTMSVIARVTPSTASPNLIRLLPALLAATWLSGFLVILFVWYVRWRQVSAAVRQAVPLREGREVVALRRLECIGQMPKRIEVRLSRVSLEPGIFGIIRPVLLWPEGISERLKDAHMEAILAHELWHVRRRDNLAAALHMAVEAIFWFYPLVWWMGARLLEERERACDEDVLELGSDRQVYAESILKTCEFCVGSPLACVSGVAGADLKKRIVRIMTEHVVRKLDFSRKLLLSALGLMAVASPVVFGLLHGTQSRAQSQIQNATATSHVYEVASIKPNKSANNMVRLMFLPDGLSVTNGTLQMLIKDAYRIEDHQISGGPSWLNSEHYDINAKMDSSTADELRKLGEDERMVERQRMLQALLADRFKLTLHRENKELPIYALVVAKGGPKLQEAKPGDTYPNGIKGPDGHAAGPGMMFMGKEGLTVQGIPIAVLVRHLSRQLGRTVVDKTGLTGKYDFTMKWTPDERQTPMFKGTEGNQPGTGGTSAPESSGPSIFTAIQEQLGLKLESQKGPVEILVIDYVERPSEN